MGHVSLGFTACILALLCTPISPTPLDKAPAGPQTPQVDPRDIVTVWVDEVVSAVPQNPPYYDTACQVGGCTFNYEASGTVLSLLRHD